MRVGDKQPPVPFRAKSAPLELLRKQQQQPTSGSDAAQADQAQVSPQHTRRASAMSPREVKQRMSQQTTTVELPPVICDGCGTQNLGSNFFCTKCNKSLVAQLKQALARCQICGTQSPPSSSECSTCKRSLSSPRSLNRASTTTSLDQEKNIVICLQCGHPNAPVHITCVQCWAKLPHRSKNPKKVEAALSGVQPSPIQVANCGWCAIL